MVRGHSPEFAENQPDPTQWTPEEQQKVAEYLKMLDETDEAFDANRKAKTRGGVRAGARSPEDVFAKWNALKTQAQEKRRELGHLKDALLKLDVGRKRGRESLRKVLVETKLQTEASVQRTKETVERAEQIKEPEEAKFDHAPEREEETGLQRVEDTKTIATGEELLSPTLSDEIVSVPSVLETSPHQEPPKKSWKGSGKWDHPEPPPEPPTFMSKLRKSKFVRGVIGVAGLLGVGKGVFETGEHLKERAESQQAARESAHDIAVTSTTELGALETGFAFDLPDGNDVITGPEGELTTRADLKYQLDTELTKAALENRPIAGRAFLEDCGVTYSFEDGSSETQIDALLAQGMYGQDALSKGGLERLAQVSGYSVAELEMYHDVMGDGVDTRPAAFAMATGLIRLSRYDIASIPGSYDSAEKDSIYEQYRLDASTMTLGVLDTLNADQMTPGAQRDVTNKLQEMAREMVEFNNQALAVASNISSMDNPYSVRALKYGIGDAEGGATKSEIEELADHYDSLVLTAKGLAALEKDPNGAVHQWARTVEAGAQTKMEQLLEAGRDAGDEAEFFTNQLAMLDGYSDPSTASL